MAWPFAGHAIITYEAAKVQRQYHLTNLLNPAYLDILGVPVLGLQLLRLRVRADRE